MLVKDPITGNWIKAHIKTTGKTYPLLGKEHPEYLFTFDEPLTEAPQYGDILTIIFDGKEKESLHGS